MSVLTDVDVMTTLQYAVLEPPDGGATWPSELWTSDEILAYLNQRQQRMLRETLLLVGEASIPVDAGTGLVALLSDWLRTVRVVWVGSDGVVRALHRSDSFAADAVFTDWATTIGKPLLYMDEEAGTRTVRIAPAPNVPGAIAVDYVPLGDPLTGNTDVLNVPECAAWGLKYGVLQDMLGKEGRGRDEQRAGYAQQRYELVIEAVKMLMSGWE